ncbi:MAG: transposase [Nitrospirota bacterium]|nr:transposase [Nitrospirota bacterium]
MKVLAERDLEVMKELQAKKVGSPQAGLTVFFDYPSEIRKVIYTTNAIESPNYSLRKALKSEGPFRRKAIVKMFYLGMQRMAEK